ncbi:MAG: dTDP-4-amino-4,6-dideoxygalactose transaminase [Bacteroidetes bacterium]|nr:dTDP-4-amino-4,6-dideoxygalactose transaminase [Bacteroidota bacterium]
MRIPFNKPYYSGREAYHLSQLVYAGQLSGNGLFTRNCHDFFTKRYGFHKVFLTTSCTDALEMAALLADLQPGDEVIMPSFTFVSAANAIILRGARIVFADCSDDYPNIDARAVEGLVTPRTRAIAVVHYAGVACDMKVVMDIAHKYNLFVIEDAAHAIDSFYNGKPLGSIGHFGAFSFHETKNIISGEGGMLAVNDTEFIQRAEIIWEKGTNRAAFKRGDVRKYEWLDIGSSFLPSEMMAAFLQAQLEDIDNIQNMRKANWSMYNERLKSLADKGYLRIPDIPEFATHNGNMFFILTHNKKERDSLLKHLVDEGIQAVFHYLPLHSSPYYKDKHDGRALKNTDRYSDGIVRLPFYTALTEKDIDSVATSVMSFFKK